MESNIKTKAIIVISLLAFSVYIVFNSGWGPSTVLTANVTYVGERHYIKGAPLPVTIKAVTSNYNEVTITIPHNIKINVGDKIKIMVKEKLLSNTKSFTFYKTESTSLTSSSSGTTKQLVAP